MPRDLSPEYRSWLLQRHDALSPRQMAWLFASLCLPTVVVALTFAWRGYWLVPAYAVLELSAIALLLRHHLRHAGDYDRIDISANGIIIEQRRANICRQLQLNAWSVRLTPPQSDSDPIRLSDRVHSIGVGTLLSARERKDVALELSRYLPTQAAKSDVRDSAFLYELRSIPSPWSRLLER